MDGQSGKVFLTGFLTVPSERLDDVRQALPDHIALTRAEAGCISFDVIEDNSQVGHFKVSEVFASQEAFDAHQDRTRQSTWYQVTQGLERTYSIRKEDEE